MTHRLLNNSHVSSMLVVPALAAKINTARALLRTRAITVAVLAVLGLSLIACGGSKSSSSTPPPAVVAVATNVSAATVASTGTMTFTASVTGSSNTAVTWSVQEANGGTITAGGVYTPPSTAGTYHVLATSQADPTKVATIAVTVTAAPPPASVSVSVTAASGTVYANLTDQFTATVTGSSNTAVTWTITEGSAGGTISATGLYAAPSTAGTYHVVATSQADTTKSKSLPVTVTIPKPTFTSTPSTTLGEAATYSYPITATDPSGTAITYTLTSPVTGASISGSALSWTPTGVAPLTGREMPTTFTVTATTALGGANTQTWIVTPLRQVVVSRIDTFWTTTGASPQALLSLPTLGATVPGWSAPTCVSGGVTYSLCAGSLTSLDGTYTIDNVPAGYYWLTIDPVEMVFTNTSSFDVSKDYVGNLDSATAVATPVTFSGLTGTFSPGDAIWVGSPNTNAWFAPQAALVTPFTDSELIAIDTLPLIATGDPSWVLQYSSSSTGNASYSGSSISADVNLETSFTYATPITGALAPSTSNTLAVTMTGWGALVPAVESGTPTVTFFADTLTSQPYAPTTPTLIAANGGGFPGCIMGSATLGCPVAPAYNAGLLGWPTASYWPQPAIIATADPNTREAGENAGPLFMAWAERCASEPPLGACQPPDGDAISLTFDNPFPTTPIVLTGQQEIQIPLVAGVSNFALSDTSAVEFATLPASATMQPVVLPVTAPLINGVDLYSTGPATAPLNLSWAAATTPTGARLMGYHIIVYSVPASGEWGAAIINLFTTDTELTVPTGLLGPGTYVFVIEARADATANVLSSPWRSSYPKGTAQVVSAPITIAGS